MKKTLVTLLMTIATMGVAQDTTTTTTTDTATTAPFPFGIGVQLHLSSFDDYTSTQLKPGTAGSIGCFAEYKFSCDFAMRLTLQAVVGSFNSTQGPTRPYVKEYFDTLSIERFKSSHTVNFIEISVNTKHYLNERAYLAPGVGLAYGMEVRVSYEGLSTEGRVYNNGEGSFGRSSSITSSFGVGYEIRQGRNWMLYVEPYLHAELFNISNDSDLEKFKSWMIGGKLGIRL